MSAFAISQILIGIAFFSDLASFQFKKREITLAFFVVSASLISTHYFFLGATAGGLIIAVSAARFFVSIFTQHVYVKYVALAAIVLSILYSFDGFEDILILMAGMFGTFAAFQKDERILRTFMMCATTSAIIFNALVWSPAAIVLELFFLGSNLLSYYRFYMRKPIPEI